MDKQIFRKGALERLSSPDQLDQLMPVTSARGWIALCGLALLIAAGIAWGFLGRIETNVEASGALVRTGGVIQVKAPGAGRVSKVLVSIGQSVEPGQSLIRLDLEASSAEGSNAKSASGEMQSTIPGRVLDIAVDDGHEVAADDLLVILERPELPLRAVVYVPTAEGYTLAPGMEARIRLASSSEQETDTLTGKVRSAGRFPVSRSSMMRSLQNEQWVDEVLRAGPLLEVNLELNSNSASRNLYSGTPCRAVITVDKQRPIALVMPIFEPVKDAAR